MGSYVSTTSTAIDNRQAITDQGFGFSSSGEGTAASLSGHIFQIGNMIGKNSNGGYKPATSQNNSLTGRDGAGGSAAATGSGININVLDQGAIGRAFDFATQSLSDTLSSVLQGQKAAQAASAYQADTLGAAIAQNAQVAAQSAKDSNTTILTFLSDNMQKLAMAGAVLAVGWYFMKGRAK